MKFIIRAVVGLGGLIAIAMFTYSQYTNPIHHGQTSQLKAAAVTLCVGLAVWVFVMITVHEMTEEAAEHDD